MLAAAMLSSACSATTSGTEGAGAALASMSPPEFCALLPITVAEGDAFTDRTAEMVLAVNLLADRICP